MHLACSTHRTESCSPILDATALPKEPLGADGSYMRLCIMFQRFDNHVFWTVGVSVCATKTNHAYRSFVVVPRRLPKTPSTVPGVRHGQA